MIPVRQAIRLAAINIVLLRHGLDEIILGTRLFRPLRFLMYLSPWNWIRTKNVDPRGVRIRRALEDLGPIFVKFGQILSIRRDLLPEDITAELERLLDDVPAFPGQQAREIVEQAYGKRIEDVFAAFDEAPLASASIAQVHSAILLDGRQVVVKVVRPNIEQIIRRDVSVLFLFADMAERYWREARRFHPREVVRDYQKTVLDELDLMREASSASQLRRDFEQSDLLHVPEICWELTRKNVMVMERVSGIPVSDIEQLTANGVNLRVLAHRGVEIFFTQVFRHNFFHADMHPGNIFVDHGNPNEPRYIAVDFGIMGSLSPDDQRYLAENFLAFFNRDYHRVAELHVLSGWVPNETRIDQFESAIRTVCEPIFERPLKDISLAQLLVRLFQTAQRFHMEVQPQLVLLQKTMLNIEALGRQLYPDLDLWETAKPFLERWMDEQLGRAALVRELRSHVPRWGEIMPALPGLSVDALRKIRDGQLEVTIHSNDLKKIRWEMKRNHRRMNLTIIGTGFIMAASFIFALDGFAPTMLGSLPVATWILGLIGAYVLLLAVSPDPD